MGKKKIGYFLHSANQFTDNPNLLKMYGKYGFKGYGIYCFLLEKLCHRVELDYDDLVPLAKDYHLKMPELQDIVMNYNLFELGVSGFSHSFFIEKQAVEWDTVKLSQKDAKKLFDEVRKLYPGVKAGLDTHFKQFVSKHKDFSEAIFKLKDGLIKEKEYRTWCEKKKIFVPKWKNFETWLNKRCWEQEYPDMEDELKNGDNQYDRFGRPIINQVRI